jgi:hypothetical protein
MESKKPSKVADFLKSKKPNKVVEKSKKPNKVADFLNRFKKADKPSKPIERSEAEPVLAKNRRFDTAKITDFLNRNRKPILITSLVVLLVTIITVGLSLFLTIGKDIIYLQAKCPDGINTPKIDCLSNVDQQMTNQQSLQSMCAAKGCCWIGDNDLSTPNCVYPYNLGYANKRYKENMYSRYWIDLLKLDTQADYTKAGINNLEAKVEMQTDSRAHIKVRALGI